VVRRYIFTEPQVFSNQNVDADRGAIAMIVKMSPGTTGVFAPLEPSPGDVRCPRSTPPGKRTSEGLPIWRTCSGRSIAITAVLLGLVNVGCARPSAYKAPVSKFRDASAVVIESTKTYLTALNKTERDHYIDDQVASRGQIQLIRIEEVQVFSADAIAARLDALDELANYTELLFRLATSDAPETIKGSAKDLGTALTNLSDQVNKLGGADDAKFKSAVNTVFPVIGDVLKALVEQRIEDALQKAITTGAAPVNDLIEAIKVDAQIAFERKRNVLSKRRADAVLQYNTEFQKGANASPAALRRYADVISETEDQWEAFKIAQPTLGLDAMQRANTALEKFARTKKPTISDFASFVDAVEVFASAAARVGQGLEQLLLLQERAAK
jgi:hypothetical protein